MAATTAENARKKLVECLVVLDDVKKFGWRDRDYNKVEANLLWVLQFLVVIIKKKTKQGIDKVLKM